MAIETTSDLSSVVSSQIVDGAVTSAKIADNAVVAAKIAAGAVGSASLESGAVVAASIAAGAVGSAAISAGSINSTHIGANAVVSGDIAAGAVGSAELASGSVVAASIAAGAVGSAALADNAVVAAKIAASAVGAVAISSGTATSGTLLTANGSGGVSFSAPPAGGGMVLIASSSSTVTSQISFLNIPTTYTRLHLIGQFSVTASGNNTITISPSTSTDGSGPSGFTTIYTLSKYSDNASSSYLTNNNNFEGTQTTFWTLAFPNMQSRISHLNLDIFNPQAVNTVGYIGLMAQQHAGKFVGHTWGEANAGGPIRSLFINVSAFRGLFRLYGS